MSVVLSAGDCCSKVRVSQVLKQCAQNAGAKIKAERQRIYIRISFESKEAV